MHPPKLKRHLSTPKEEDETKDKSTSPAAAAAPDNPYEHLYRNLQGMITDFNNRIKLIGQQVLLPGTPKDRAKRIQAFVDIGWYCHRVHNFNTVFVVVRGLDAHYITKMETAWDLVSAAHLKKLADLRAVAAAKDNYARYRREVELAKASVPFVPAISVVCGDLGGMSLMPTRTESLVNVDKFLRMYQAVLRAQEGLNGTYDRAAGAGATTKKYRWRQPHHDEKRFKADEALQALLVDAARHASTVELFLEAQSQLASEKNVFVDNMLMAGI